MTQNEHILAWLESGRSISPREADDMFGCTRLGARIYDLKRRGYPIISERVDGFNKFGDKCHWARRRNGGKACLGRRRRDKYGIV